MLGGEPPANWIALAPLIKHPTRRLIVHTLRREGPLPASELGCAVDGPNFRRARLSYHANVLVGGGALKAKQLASGENVYSLAPTR